MTLVWMLSHYEESIVEEQNMWSWQTAEGKHVSLGYNLNGEIPNVLAIPCNWKSFPEKEAIAYKFSINSKKTT